jgi:hypothetical protein
MHVVPKSTQLQVPRAAATAWATSPSSLALETSGGGCRIQDAGHHGHIGIGTAMKEGVKMGQTFDRSLFQILQELGRRQAQRQAAIQSPRKHYR